MWLILIGIVVVIIIIIVGKFCSSFVIFGSYVRFLNVQYKMWDLFGVFFSFTFPLMLSKYFIFKQILFFKPLSCNNRFF